MAAFPPKIGRSRRPSVSRAGIPKLLEKPPRRMLNIKNPAHENATMKSTLATEMLQIAKSAPRLYFAPLIGAIKEVRSELRKNYKAESKK